MELEQKLLLVANYVRMAMVHQHSTQYGLELYGTCIEACDMIVDMLHDIGISAKAIEGWCIYEDDASCSDRCYDEHTWVECEGYYIDVTADQFNSCMFCDLKEIYVTKDKPKCMVYTEPEYNWLEERDKSWQGPERKRYNKAHR